MLKTFAVAGYDGLVHSMMSEAGWKHTWDDPTLIIFTGGADVHPMLYGDVAHPLASNILARDSLDLAHYAQQQDVKLRVGICRGGQFLNVMSGGTLWQDVDRHTGTHPLFFTPKGTFHLVTSTHHQMMRPSAQGDVWGQCERSTYRDTGRTRGCPSNFVKDGPDIEIVFYQANKSLCFQPHPEYSLKENGRNPCRELFFDCLDRALGAV